MAQFDEIWMSSWREKVNSDGVMRLVGRHLDAEIMLEFGDTGYLVSFRGGELIEVQTDLGPETCWSLALRAPEASWAKFVQPTPPPMYNDIWAMAHPLHGRLKIDGNVKVLWQNLRALTWALDLMRRVH